MNKLQVLLYASLLVLCWLFIIFSVLALIDRFGQ